MHALTTWAGTHVFTAPELIEATSVEGVQQVVAQATAGGRRARALGTRHSFNGLADTDGTLITVAGIDPRPVIDREAGTVTVGSGMRFGELAVWLQEQGMALHNMGSLPHISVGGATSTATHGSGNRNGVLATSIRALEIVTADGSLATVRDGDPDFPGLVVGLGAAGIVVRTTLSIEPSFTIRQDSFAGLPWDAVLDDLESVTGAAYSVSLLSEWATDTIRLAIWKTRLEGDDTSGGVPDEWNGAHRNPDPDMRLFGVPADNETVAGGIPGPWLERLPHFRLDKIPSAGAEIQSEYFVDRANGSAALRAVRALGDRIDPLLLVTELRTTAADRLWLSGSYDRDTLAIHFTWKPELEAVLALLPDIEAALAPFDARPHWGKVNGMDAAALARVHPRLADARALFERYDPAGTFSSSYLEDRGVRERR